jgi:hypothetical protein
MINSDLSNIKKWSEDWLITFNPDKTDIMLFDSRRQGNLTFKFGQTNILSVDFHKHLGIVFSSDGKWTRHIDYILSKASKQVGVLRKLKFILKREILEKIYLTFIRPLLEYSCEVWDNCSQTDNDRLEKLQLEAARIVTALTVYSSRESLYQETGWEKLSSRRERKKLCLMFNMYHGHAPSYLCDLLPPLVRDDGDVTNYPVRNRNDYIVPRCRLSLYQSPFIPSVINLWNSLDNDTRNTRTFDTFKINLKRKVVLANIPAHFLVGDRRPNVLYARLRRNCSSLKYDLFRSNIITNSRCVCGYIREDASHFLLNCRLYIEQRTILFNFLHHHHNFRKDIGTLLFGDSQKDQAQNILQSNAVQTFIKNSRQFTEGT